MRRIILLIIVTMLMTACNDSLVFSEYGHVPVTGWEKSDAIDFDVAPLSKDATLNMSLALRVMPAYPFQNLHLVVQQTVLPAGTQTMDTLTCRITDARGNMLGEGVTYYQYETMVRKQHYNHGDSLRISVHHDMKREILPGITDVGITLTEE